MARITPNDLDAMIRQANAGADMDRPQRQGTGFTLVQSENAGDIGEIEDDPSYIHAPRIKPDDEGPEEEEIDDTPPARTVRAQDVARPRSRPNRSLPQYTPPTVELPTDFVDLETGIAIIATTPVALGRADLALVKRIVGLALVRQLQAEAKVMHDKYVPKVRPRRARTAPKVVPRVPRTRAQVPASVPTTPPE